MLDIIISNTIGIIIIDFIIMIDLIIIGLDHIILIVLFIGTIIITDGNLNFREFLQQIDERQIDAIYQKAKVAVEIVRMYNPKLLENIATIANLPSGAYGLYNSGENRKILPQETEKALISWGKVGRHNLDMLPIRTIQQYYPQIPINSIKQSDTIRVNVNRIMREFSDDTNRILQIASTIVHEATHEIDQESGINPTEDRAYGAEKQFMNWIQQNWEILTKKFPDLATSQPQTTIIPKHGALNKNNPI
jgi:hypothetical protein